MHTHGVRDHFKHNSLLYMHAMYMQVNLIFLILGVRATIRGRISHAVATGKQEELNKLQIAK